ncbi:glycine--tRNA ligase subunit beta [Sphingomonas sp. RP10(2022)]|uniref:Glycine--tRNA ligase beta subunit n=1 Tax=Sphingomonas liriopis TaxID=2949094 RepID=A0A9X2HYQ2_9SPHN|nr:glycine--tRNA ligase subunit beta [Sphingomonas liriopis]MCP3735993.1 glycine--tRNA ligase subunit beta [Sphingomonas liriopis]
MTDFLLELRSEEIPARMQDKARDDLARLFAAELAKAGLQAAELVTYATPRRLALIARDLPAETQAVSEEVKGPKTSAPPQALEGFLRKTGLTREQLTERDGVLYAVTDKPGRATTAVLAEAIPAIVRAFPWPKSMRWGAASTSTESLRWVRPLHGIVALFGEELVEVEIAGIRSGYAAFGHRFHHPGQITIGSAADYVEKLRACHVIVDQDERRTLIRNRAGVLAAEAGLSLVEDEGLVAENAGLTEWPVPLLGRFDAEFLTVPPEVIQLTARVNQKYFVCRDASGALANAFICTANIEASDGGAKIVEGNRKVLAARLSDARFFYDTDLKTPLEEQAAKLSNIVFHEKLGTVADKVDRVAKLARWLVEEGIILPGTGRGTSEAGGGGAPQAVPPAEAPLHHQPSADGPPPRTGEELADMAERAARLAKADLVTGMVGEFPELQGLMGGYYAAAQGEAQAVADAIRDHYKPVGQGDDVPTAPVTVAVSLADKLDTLAAFFVANLPPTGSKDPFALRRAALAVIALVLENGLRLSLDEAALRIVWDLGLKPYRDRMQSDVAFNTLMQRIWPEFPDHPDDDSIASRGAALMAEQPDLQPFIKELFGKFTDDAPAIMKNALPAAAALRDFFADRLKVQQREAGVRHDLIDAVFALGGEDDLVRLLARVRALQAFVTTEDGANLLAGYKRAANILKKEGVTQIVTPANAGVSGEGAGQEPREAPAFAGATDSALTYTPEPAEAALIAALDAAEPAATAAVAAEDFERAMAALASLRAPIDAFFDDVTVNDADPAKRAARLALLARVRAAVHGVADFAKIEG